MPETDDNMVTVVFRRGVPGGSMFRKDAVNTSL